MPFLITAVAYLLVFGVIVAKRPRLARFFNRRAGGLFRAVLLSALVFAVLEEGTLNLFGSPLVMIVTVPTLVVILLVVGYVLHTFWPDLSWRKAVVAFVIAGLVFELVIGQLGQSIKAGGVDGRLVFGLLLNIFAYTYIAIVPYSILFSPARDGALLGAPPT
jgi:hypothetical protein